MRSSRTLKVHRDGTPFGGWQPGIYRLISVQDGRHDVSLVEEQFTADAGDVYVLHPGALRWVTVGRGFLAHVIGFIVVRVPGSELVHEQGFAYRLRDTQHRQPTAEAIWGRPVAAKLPTDVAQRIREDIAQCVAIGWRDAWQRAEADLLLGRILWTMVNYNYQPSRPLPSVHNGGVSWLEQIEHDIDRRLASIRSTGDLAAVVGVSTDHFARVFRDKFGCSPSDYVRKRRLEEVARLLAASDAGLEAIAGLVGFRDATALAHAWHKAYGVSAGVWRRQQRRIRS